MTIEKTIELQESKRNARSAILRKLVGLRRGVEDSRNTYDIAEKCSSRARLGKPGHACHEIDTKRNDCSLIAVFRSEVNRLEIGQMAKNSRLQVKHEGQGHTRNENPIAPPKEPIPWASAQ